MIVNLCTPGFDPADSYGRISIELSDALQAAGWHVNEFTFGSPVRQKVMKVAMGGILLGYPTNFFKFGALVNTGVKIALTMFESDHLPTGWAEVLNTCAAVIVPAQFLVQVFRDSGVTVPIHVAPLGISPVFHKAQRRKAPRQWSDKTPLKVLVIGDRGYRKNFHEMAMAHHRAFGDDMRYQLTIKTRTNGLTRKNEAGELLHFGFSNPNITLIEQDMTDAELAALYREHHVLMFGSRGEGFGFPPREFAAMGGVALATDWGGTADDIQHWGVPLPYSMETAWRGSDKFYGVCGQWAAPDMNAASTLLKHIAAHYDDYASHAIRGAGFVQTRYTWQRFVREVKAIYERYSSGVRRIPAQIGG
jgi:glycosyltransferase involved in cell wall biosynthesis